MLHCSVIAFVCSPGLVAIGNQEAVPPAVAEIPPGQRRRGGHVHEDRQSLRRVRVARGGSPWPARFAPFNVLGLPAVSPMSSPERTGKCTATRMVQAVSWCSFLRACKPRPPPGEWNGSSALFPNLFFFDSFCSNQFWHRPACLDRGPEELHAGIYLFSFWDPPDLNRMPRMEQLMRDDESGAAKSCVGPLGARQEL